MPVFGATPMGETNGTSLGIGYVRLTTNNLGAIIKRERWSYELQDYEVGPRVDAKHVVPYQRLSDDAGDVENGVQLAPVPREAMESAGVLAVTYNIDSTGKAVGVYRVAERNIVTAIASINPIY